MSVGPVLVELRLPAELSRDLFGGTALSIFPSPSRGGERCSRPLVLQSLDYSIASIALSTGCATKSFLKAALHYCIAGGRKVLQGKVPES